MEKLTSHSNDWKARMSKTTVHLAEWTAGWVITMALATFGPNYLWGSQQWLTIIAILLNLSFGLGMIVAYIRHLKMQDEMMQKIQLQAMAIALGVGVVGGLSYSLLDTTNIISSDAEIPYLVILIGITYLVSLIVNRRRYR
jgi:hypothetical protein